MQLSWIREGVETSLDDGVLCLRHKVSGLGMPALHRLTERGPLQHGETDRGFRLDPRTIQLVLGTHSALSADDLEGKSNQLMGMFHPNMPGALKIVTDGQRRQIDAYLVDGFAYASDDRLGWWQKHGLTLRANDPTFYDPAGEAVTFSLGGGGGAGLIVPMPVPFEVGGSAISHAIAIDYPGTWRAYPFIRITGPITDCVIRKVIAMDDSPLTEEMGVDEKLDFTGVTIDAGRWYEIDLRYGYKTVVSEAGVNKIADLTSDSDLATFHLTENMTNTISVTGSAVDANTRIDITYFVRYLGL